MRVLDLVMPGEKDLYLSWKRGHPDTTGSRREMLLMAQGASQRCAARRARSSGAAAEYSMPSFNSNLQGARVSFTGGELGGGGGGGGRFDQVERGNNNDRETRGRNEEARRRQQHAQLSASLRRWEAA